VGTVRLVTDASGGAENAYRYYPFGDSLYASGSLANDMKYSGKPQVPGIEAYDYSARYYDPDLGRFYSLDPIPSGGSPYGYCANNPLKYVDPSGMTCLPIMPEDGGCSGSGGGGEWIKDLETGISHYYGWGEPTLNWADASGEEFNLFESWEKYMVKYWEWKEDQTINELLKATCPDIIDDLGDLLSNLQTKSTNSFNFTLDYNKTDELLTLCWGSDTYYFVAGNKTIKKAHGYEPGIYFFKKHTTHSDDAYGSRYGQFGNFKYPSSDYPNAGIHSGREYSGGWQHVTKGCIRTTPIGTYYLYKMWSTYNCLPPLNVHY